MSTNGETISPDVDSNDGFVLVKDEYDSLMSCEGGEAFFESVLGGVDDMNILDVESNPSDKEESASQASETSSEASSKTSAKEGDSIYIDGGCDDVFIGDESPFIESYGTGDQISAVDDNAVVTTEDNVLDDNAVVTTEDNVLDNDADAGVTGDADDGGDDDRSDKKKENEFENQDLIDDEQSPMIEIENVEEQNSTIDGGGNNSKKKISEVKTLVSELISFL